MPIVDGKAVLQLTQHARAPAQKGQRDLVKNLFVPHLAVLPLSCGNCGFEGFKVAVSPLRGEVDGAAVVRGVACLRCGQKVNIEDGNIPGLRDNPVGRFSKELSHRRRR